MRALLVLLLLALTACSAPYDPTVAGGTDPELRQGPVTSGLTARFFGVSTILLSDGRTGIMTDGFFSRPKISEISALRPDVYAIDWALAQGGVGRGEVKAVLVAHSHHDHALDSATVAGKLDADVVGSVSTCRILRAQSFPSGRTWLIGQDGGEVYQFGQVGEFKVRIFKSRHTPPPPPPFPPLLGDVDDDFEGPASVFKFREGGSFSFLIEHGDRRILIHPGTNLHADDQYAGQQADVVFLGVALLARQGEAFARNYWNNVVIATGAKLVIPIHWDDIQRPIDKPVRFLGWPDDVPRSMKLIQKFAAETNGAVTVKFMRRFEPIDVLAAAGPGPVARKPLPPASVRQTCPASSLSAGG